MFTWMGVNHMREVAVTEIDHADWFQWFHTGEIPLSLVAKASFSMAKNTPDVLSQQHKQEDLS